MAISIYSLGSGSKGNCVIVANGKSNIMIDAGLTPRATRQKLNEIGLSINDIDGILLTHEHNDHVKSLEDLTFHIPLFSNYQTLRAVENRSFVNAKKVIEIEESTFTLGDYEITPFSISHDAARPFGFILSDGKEKVGYLTDTGYVSKGIMNKIAGSDIVVIESNHDEELLRRGAYPERLKRRILSDKGHLNNYETALTVNDLVKGGTKKIMLAHISENNNLSELAYWTTVKCLNKNGISEKDIALKVAMQRETVIL